MNDPMGNGDAEAVRVNHSLLLAALEAEARARGTIIRTGVTVQDVTDLHVQTSEGSFKYSRIITTLPLPASRTIFHFPIPETFYKSLTVARSNSLPLFLLDRDGMEFDYIYTPRLEVFHRISRFSLFTGGWEYEATGALRDEEVEVFDGEVKFQSIAHIPGHLLPLEKPVEWPKNILPLGRFAEWDTRSTAEKSLDRLVSWRGV